MGIGFTVLLIVHILICLLLILLVTVQNDKGGGLAGAFGGGGGGAFTGSSAVTILTKMTQWVAAIGFVVLLGLSALGSRANQSAMGESELKGASKGLSGAIQGAAPIEGTLGPTQTQNAVPGAAPAPEAATPGAAQ
jgi:preprotein translocase subunit SecG